MFLLLLAILIVVIHLFNFKANRNDFWLIAFAPLCLCIISYFAVSSFDGLPMLYVLSAGLLGVADSGFRKKIFYDIQIEEIGLLLCFYTYFIPSKIGMVISFFFLMVLIGTHLDKFKDDTKKGILIWMFHLISFLFVVYVLSMVDSIYFFQEPEFTFKGVGLYIYRLTLVFFGTMHFTSLIFWDRTFKLKNWNKHIRQLGESLSSTFYGIPSFLVLTLIYSTLMVTYDHFLKDEIYSDLLLVIFLYPSLLVWLYGKLVPVRKSIDT